MNFNKKVSGSWTDVPHYIASTDTETITTLPTTIYPLGQSATLGLKGNTVQNGTPTPDNPVPVVGVGDLDNGQYKIPISSNSTTTNVYLGEVQTTRKIRKLVLTGEEEWLFNATSFVARISLDNALSSGGITSMSTHYNAVTNKAAYTDMHDGDICVRRNGEQLWICDYSYSSVTDFKSYLAQQYVAGTPVTVWYILSTEQTGIVNESLMKIGDYADSISGISITTTAGANTLDVQTSLKPSEVTASFNGWHPVSSAHERSGGSWT